jgi:hypothetical protein
LSQELWATGRCDGCGEKVRGLIGGASQSRGLQVDVENVGLRVWRLIGRVKAEGSR